MKKIKIVLAAIALILFFTNKIKAQYDNPNCRIVLDGNLIPDSIGCYSFDELWAVFPYNADWANYDKINVGIHFYYPNKIDQYEKSDYHYVSFTKKEYTDFFAGAKLCMVKIIASKFENNKAYNFEAKGGPLTKPYIYKRYREGGPGAPQTWVNNFIFVQVRGLNESEENGTVLTRSLPTAFKTIFFREGIDNPISRDNIPFIDGPCTLRGTPFTLKKEPVGTRTDIAVIKQLGAGNSMISTGEKSIGLSKTTINTAASSEPKIILTTAVPASEKALKPFDKTKPGYFQQRSEDGKFLYREGCQLYPGKYHGEVREYGNNMLEKITIYSYGMEDGLYLTFDDGKVEWVGSFKLGKREGVWKKYKGGEVVESDTYLNGEKQD